MFKYRMVAARAKFRRLFGFRVEGLRFMVRKNDFDILAVKSLFSLAYEAYMSVKY